MYDYDEASIQKKTDKGKTPHEGSEKFEQSEPNEASLEAPEKARCFGLLSNLFEPSCC